MIRAGRNNEAERRSGLPESTVRKHTTALSALLVAKFKSSRSHGI